MHPYAVDYQSNKTVLPKILDMHFIFYGDYIPDHDVQKQIESFREYKDKSKSIWNMLKEKQRNDRKKMLEKEEEKYKKKLKGKRYEKEDKAAEEERLAEIMKNP